MCILTHTHTKKILMPSPSEDLGRKQDRLLRPLVGIKKQVVGQQILTWHLKRELKRNH